MTRHAILRFVATIVAGVVLLAGVTASAARPALTDSAITAAVDAQLLRRLARGAVHAVDTEARGGVVTLTGKVPDLLTKRRAVEVAGAVRGVRAVVDMLRVEALPRADAAIRSDIVAALKLEPVTEAHDVAVDVNGGNVTLRGIVQSAQERDVAERVAAAIPGVRAVRNGVAIQYATARTDADIEADVRSRLRWDARVDARGVQVIVRNGNVVLSGDIGSVAERVVAVNDAWVNGVRIVTDRLRVVPGAAAAMRAPLPTPTDAEIRNAVIHALALDPRVVSFNPVVSVRDGVVTLSGAVDDLQARNAAEQDARNVAGVRRVENRLAVRPLVGRSDLAIADDVRQALRWDVGVDAAAVTVSVRSGVVYLTGTADSRYERDAASNVAARVDGVVGVVNQMVLSATVPAKSDLAIERDAESGIVWNAFVDGSEIDVAVTNGVATLTGTVGSFADLREAEAEAFEAGATRVVNLLAIDASAAAAGGVVAPRVRPWWIGVTAEMLMAFIVATLFAAGLAWLLRSRGAALNRAALVLFFVTVFPATWALGVWVTPRGPTAFGVPWLAFLAIGLAVSLVASAAPAVRPWRVQARGGAPEPVRVAGPLIWILLVMLVLAIVGNHMQDRRAAVSSAAAPVETGRL